MKVSRKVLLPFLVLVSVAIASFQWSPLSARFAELDREGFFYDLLWEVNDDRRLFGSNPLVEDVHLQAWVEGVVREEEASSSLSTTQVLTRLKEEVPSVAAASILIVQARDEGALIKRIAEWAREAEEEHSHLASCLYRDAENGGLSSLALMVQRLPKFRPEFLNRSQRHAFYNVCPICKSSHHGKVMSVARSIVLECPRCARSYDLMAIDQRGGYHRVTDFLVGEEPPEEIARGVGGAEDRFREMVAIWTEVLNACRYVKDFKRLSGQRDAWQFPNETVGYRSGDCEDTSILLADWLISRGFDARVALGRTSRFEGHAWCVVNLDGQEYLLETTEAEPDMAKPPTVERVGEQYVPDFLFNRKQIFFRSEGDWGGTYWAETDWMGIGHGMQDAGSEVAAALIVD